MMETMTYVDRLPLIKVFCDERLIIQSVSGQPVLEEPDFYLPCVGQPLSALWPGITRSAKRAQRGIDEFFYFQSPTSQDAARIYIFPKQGEHHDADSAPDGGCVVYAFPAETECLLTEEIDLLVETGQHIGYAGTVEDALNDAMKKICRRVSACYGEVWLVDERGENVVRNEAFYSEGDFDAAAFRNRSQTLSILLKSPSPIYHALKTGKPIRMTREDLERQIHQPDGIYEQTSPSLGLVVPVFIDEKPAVCFQFCIEGADHPSPRLERILCAVCTQLGSFLLRKRTDLEKEKYQERLRSLTIEMAAMEDEERKRLAQVLHDSLGLSLALSRMRLSSALKTGEEIPEKAFSLLHEVEDSLKEAVKQTRLVTAEISPHILYEVGLMAGLNWLEEFMEAKFGQRIVTETEAEEPDGSMSLKVMAFQITRELLVNAGKHSEATDIVVQAKVQKDNRVMIRVKDNGKGFDRDAVMRTSRERGGFGLFSANERVEYMKGTLLVQSEPGQGTDIQFTFPLREKGEET